MKERIGAEGLDLLWHLLDLNPEKRISAEAALQHPFFQELRQTPEPLLDTSLNSLIPAYSPKTISDQHLAHFLSLLHSNEQRLQPHRDYMAHQPHITENMRSILVDWLVDVSVHFEVMSETLHFAINYIDRTLSHLPIEKNKL